MHLAILLVILSIIYAFYAFMTWYYSSTLTSASLVYSKIEPKFKLPVSILRKIRKEFVSEMFTGLDEADDLSREKKKSSLAMLSSFIESIPKGTEKGIYYAMDWGGSNYRVSRIQFLGLGLTPKISEFKKTIEEKYKKCNNRVILFDYLSLIFKNELIKNGDYNTTQFIRIGFTFSFPINQLSLNTGILKEWRKGFNIPRVVGNNVVSLMHQSFTRNNINAEISVICNDAVGTLLSSAYSNSNVRIGVIIGTGTNASYIESNRKIPHNIINMEWGSFISSNIIPYKTDIDINIDPDLIKAGMVKYAKNNFITKLISGNFLGELVRKLLVKIYKNNERWNSNSSLNNSFALKTEILSDILDYYYCYNIDGLLLNILHSKFKLNKFNKNDAKIVAKSVSLVVHRSADLASCMLLGTLEKTGLYEECDNDVFKLRNKYINNYQKYVTVGVDGSVIQKIPKYKERMMKTITKIVGADIAQKIQIVDSKDGSGLGAALAVAAVK